MSGTGRQRSTRTAAPGEARIIDLRSPDVLFVSGDVPIDGRGVPDCRGLREAAAAAVAALQPGQLVVLTHSPYVGATAELLAEPLVARGLVPGRDVFVAARAAGPGFTVIGGMTRECTRRALLWLPGSKGAPAPVSSAATAELIGLAGAALTAAREALSWELGELCRKFGVSEAEVLPAAELVGGTATRAAALDWQVRAIQPSPLLETTMTVHRGHARKLASRVREELAKVGKSLAWSRIVVVPGDDARLATDVADLLRQEGAEAVVQSPAVAAGTDCDLVIQLGGDLPAAGAQSFSIFLSRTGAVLSGPDL